MGIGLPTYFAADVPANALYAPRPRLLAATTSGPVAPWKPRPCEGALLAVPPPPPPPGLTLQRSAATSPKYEDCGARNPPRRSRQRRQTASRNQPKELTTGVLMSRGSKNHCKGQCRPCRLCHTPEGCPNGASCNFCHFAHDDVRMLEIEVSRLKAHLRRVMTKTAGAEEDEEAQTEETASTDDTATEFSQLGHADHGHGTLDQLPDNDIPESLCALTPTMQYELPSRIRMSF